jgi:hypothetical protein
VIIAQSEFLPRAEHSVGYHSAHFSEGNLKSTGKNRSHGSERHEVTQGKICCPTDNLHGTVTGIHDDVTNSVGAFNRTDLVDPSDDNLIQTFADVLHTLYYQAQVVHFSNEGRNILWQVDEFS